MPVTTRSRKRAERESSSANTSVRSSKRARKSKVTRKAKSKTNAVEARGPVPAQYKTLQGANFPVRILALPHVLKHIDEFAMKLEEMMVQAVEAGEYDTLSDLSQKLGGDVSVAFEYAAENGRCKAVAALLPEVIGEGEYNLDDTVLGELEASAVAAAINGHVDVVDLLLGEIQMEREDEHEGEFVYYGYEREIEESKNDAAWKVLDAAAENGHVDVVESAAGYATMHQSFSAEERSCALSRAISSGYTDVVAFLIGCDEFNWDALRAFEQAVDEEQHDVAEVIYDHFADGSRNENLLVQLAGRGYEGAVAYLLEKGFADSDLAGEAFVSAMGGSQTSIANFLLDTELVPSMAVDKAFKQAYLHASMKSVEFLLNKGLVSTQAICKALERATNFAVVKLLLEKEQIPPKSVITAFRNASTRGGFSGGKDATATVHFLSKNVNISPGIVSEAFLEAVENCYGSAEVVEVLYDEERISPDVVRAVFKTAADRGYYAIVSFLLDKPAIDQATKHQALVSAVLSKHVDVVQRLVQHGDFPMDVLNSALKATRNQAIKRLIRVKSLEQEKRCAC